MDAAAGLLEVRQRLKSLKPGNARVTNAHSPLVLHSKGQKRIARSRTT
jgi:hypothetical protein